MKELDGDVFTEIVSRRAQCSQFISLLFISTPGLVYLNKICLSHITPTIHGLPAAGANKCASGMIAAGTLNSCKMKF